jgi:hypothetical protein
MMCLLLRVKIEDRSYLLLLTVLSRRHQHASSTLYERETVVVGPSTATDETARK